MLSECSYGHLRETEARRHATPNKAASKLHRETCASTCVPARQEFTHCHLQGIQRQLLRDR